MSRYTANLLGIFGIAVVVALVGFAVSRKANVDMPTPVPNEEAVVCTMEAKICPDGSSVGRTGPTCEFALCPGATSTPNHVPTGMAAWNLLESPGSDVTIRYPNNLGTTYMRASEWPPKLTTEPGRFTCFETKASPQGVTTKRTINGVQYCVTMQSEGAAGSTYVTYTYVTEKENTRIKLVFTVQEPQCLNYDQPKQSECSAERERFSADTLVSQMIATVANAPAERMK